MRQHQAPLPSQTLSVSSLSWGFTIELETISGCEVRPNATLQCHVSAAALVAPTLTVCVPVCSGDTS